MRKARILLILGVWIAILPHLGFPYSWKDILFTLTGLGIIFFSYVLYHDYRSKEAKKIGEKTFDNFKENSDYREDEKIEDISNDNTNKEI